MFKILDYIFITIILKLIYIQLIICSHFSACPCGVFTYIGQYK